MNSSWLAILPTELLLHIASLVQQRLHDDLMTELSQVEHQFSLNQCHTINFAGIQNGTKYLKLQCSIDTRVVEIETTSVSYWEPECTGGEPVVMITSNDHERFWLDNIWLCCTVWTTSLTHGKTYIAVIIVSQYCGMGNSNSIKNFNVRYVSLGLILVCILLAMVSLISIHVDKDHNQWKVLVFIRSIGVALVNTALFLLLLFLPDNTARKLFIVVNIPLLLFATVYQQITSFDIPGVFAFLMYLTITEKIQKRKYWTVQRCYWVQSLLSSIIFLPSILCSRPQFFHSATMKHIDGFVCTPLDCFELCSVISHN